MQSLDGRSHIPGFDGLRALAMLAVMLFHYTSVTAEVSPLYWGFAKSGWVGVDLLFVLSGFVITRILLSTREKVGYFKNFYARRAVRIFPLFYGYLLGITVILPLLLPADGDVQ